jgi:hypothetical protein
MRPAKPPITSSNDGGYKVDEVTCRIEIKILKINYFCGIVLGTLSQYLNASKFFSIKTTGSGLQLFADYIEQLRSPQEWFLK